MARLPALVAALGEEDGRDLSTLNVIARTVREAGHMTTTKRGRGGAEMTIRDAANLLIGANGSESIKDAAAVIEPFRSLVSAARTSHREGLLGRLDRASCFGDAVELLIEHAGELSAMLLDREQRADPDLSLEEHTEAAWGRWPNCGLNITLYRPSFFATIEVWAGHGPDRIVSDEWRFLQSVNGKRKGFYPVANGSRRVAVTVGFRALMKLHAAMFGATDLKAAPGG